MTSLRSVALTSSDIGIDAVVTAPQVTLSGASSFSTVTEGVNGGLVSAAVSVQNEQRPPSAGSGRPQSGHVGGGEDSASSL